jgi:hypothetical protein
MKTSTTCRMLALTVLATAMLSWAQSPDQADPWSVLNKITHKRTYTIQTRDLKCVWATMTGVNADRITAKAYTSNSAGSPTDTVTFSRADVLRVKSGRFVYYSGRSSWLDVSSIGAKGRERLKIVTKAGKTYNAKLPYTVSDDGITLQNLGQPSKVSKSEIAQVYDIVAKPLTTRGEYLVEELGPFIIFDPDLYVYGLHLEQYVPVLLYNASEPEDNSPAQCAGTSLNRK